MQALQVARTGLLGTHASEFGSSKMHKPAREQDESVLIPLLAYFLHFGAAPRIPEFSCVHPVALNFFRSGRSALPQGLLAVGALPGQLLRDLQHQWQPYNPDKESE